MRPPKTPFRRNFSGRGVAFRPYVRGPEIDRVNSTLWKSRPFRPKLGSTIDGRSILYRVLVIGCSGSGKSTVARELARITGLPAVHLDLHYWRPDWTEPDKVLWSAEIASLVAQPRWIMDGNY